jgi:hypothetical protein
MKHTPESAWLRPIPVQPFYMDVTAPAELHSFDVPPGRSEQSWQARAPMDGRILGMGGHLHERAIELRLEDVTAGSVIWRTKPILDENGRLAGMPQSKLWWRLGIPVKEGHVYRLVSVYQNDTGVVLPAGGMGALGGVLVPERGAEWPAADPSHPDYQKDIAIRFEGRDRAPMMGTGTAGHGGHTHKH